MTLSTMAVPADSTDDYPPHHRVFLGGACGTTTWRRDTAIPALQAAGVPFHDPQLPPDAWTPACEAAEMAAKDRCQVLLWVVGAETRGVASVAEAAYYIAAGRRLALAMVDVPDDAVFDGRAIDRRERDDLQRGRIFVRTMAREHGVPVWPTVAAAVQHAIALARHAPLSAAAVRSILADVTFPGAEFVVHEDHGVPTLQLRSNDQRWHSRPWPITPLATASEVVQTALKAVLTWQEHEAREGFLYRGQPVFGPHHHLEGLLAQCRAQPDLRRAP
ncbi:MAG: nucleoside 2-deoxyribosyltransferase domain-containing protein [Planctomycetes bacterium]|nr:nucleoside 2-deoxyribosyltransferase domain-containing protein [Planctomycetota bacterium]